MKSTKIVKAPPPERALFMPFMVDCLVAGFDHLFFWGRASRRGCRDLAPQLIGVIQFVGHEVDGSICLG